MNILSFFYLKYQISDLNGLKILQEISLSKLKKTIDILIIDDEEFPLLDDLRKHEFNIVYKEDISDLKDVEAYSIILCDIHGVGKFLGSRNEGAYLVHQIKNKYPSKILISYTADSTSIGNQKFLIDADKVIPKGTSIEDWASILEEAVCNLVDPVRVWKKTEENLFKSDVSTRKIAEIENRYVKAIKNKKYESLSKLFADDSNVAKILKETIPFIIEILMMIKRG